MDPPTEGRKGCASVREAGADGVALFPPTLRCVLARIREGPIVAARSTLAEQLVE